jgi:hypothetical protein
MNLSGKFYGVITNHKTGEITCWEKHNMVVKSGFDWVAGLMSTKTSRSPAISHIAFGTDGSETTYNMTRLGNEVYRTEVEATWDADTRELKFVGSIPQKSGLAVSISEVGLFNAETNGVMFDRAYFTPKGIDDDMSFEYTFTITLTE